MLPGRRAFHLLHPVIERPPRHTHELDRIAVFHAVQKIDFEQLQPAFPLRPAQRLAADALAVRDIFTGAPACRTPGISRRWRFQINCAHFAGGVFQPVMQAAVSAVTSVKHFRRFHFSSARPELVDQQLVFQLVPRLCQIFRWPASRFAIYSTP